LGKNFLYLYTDGSKNIYATPLGFQEEAPEKKHWFKYSSDFLVPFLTPDWAKNGVLYQIFPDRFRNGDLSNDQDFKEKYYKGKIELPPEGKTNEEYFHLVRNWDNIAGLKKSPYRTDERPDYYSFYGGDIAGVMEKLAYLKDLGITIIYFNPLNEGKSNHKYDPVDYLRIDPHFADRITFKKFVKKAHDYGIRVIVDMAFNHTGDEHFAFVDTREKGERSKYWKWFEWKQWPLPKGGPPTPCDYYDCWWGFPIHPNLNFDLSRPNNEENTISDISQADPNMDVVNYILEVPKYWMGELGVDGFRLDVPNEVPLWLWKEFRKTVEEVNPDAFLVGEIWGNAMPWLGPQCFHSTMNYKYFRDLVLTFFAMGTISADKFDRSLASGRNIYPIQATQVMMNLIGSHDTERFLTIAGNDERRLMLAALFQMTYPGIPQIYYGDEVALQGGKDPDNRRTFPWDWERRPVRKKVHAFYRKVISLRHSYSALRTGKFRTLVAHGKLYVYLREDQENRIIVAINNIDHARKIRIDLKDHVFSRGTFFRDVFNTGDYTIHDNQLQLELKPYSGAVLVAMDN
jgi:glycosidase